MLLLNGYYNPKERRVVELRKKGMTYRQIAEEAKISPRDIKKILLKYRVDDISGYSENEDEVDSDSRMSISSRAYKLYSEEMMTPLEVAIALNIEASEAIRYHDEFLELNGRGSLTKLFEGIGNEGISWLLRLCAIARTKKMSISRVIECVSNYDEDASNIIATAFAYEFSTQQDIALFLISIAYPILDTVFVAPAGLIILNNLGIGQLTSIPWIFISMMITALADSIFGFSSSGGIANETSLIWNPIYVAGYSLMAAELYWYNRFFIYGKPNNLGGYHLVTPGIPEIGKAMDHDDRCQSFANRDVVYAYPVIVGIMMCHIFVDIVLGELGISYSAYIYVSFQSFTSFFL
jgi:hypothetical protein